MDPDDAPELTAKDLKRGYWRINGKRVSDEEGRAAMIEALNNTSDIRSFQYEKYSENSPKGLWRRLLRWLGR